MEKKVEGMEKKVEGMGKKGTVNRYSLKVIAIRCKNLNFKIFWYEL